MEQSPDEQLPNEFESFESLGDSRQEKVDRAAGDIARELGDVLDTVQGELREDEDLTCTNC